MDVRNYRYPLRPFSTHSAKCWEPQLMGFGYFPAAADNIYRLRCSIPALGDHHARHERQP
jgi:hypothetical protein